MRWKTDISTNTAPRYEQSPSCYRSASDSPRVVPLSAQEGNNVGLLRRSFESDDKCSCLVSIHQPDGQAAARTLEALWLRLCYQARATHGSNLFIRYVINMHKGAIIVKLSLTRPGKLNLHPPPHPTLRAACALPSSHAQKPLEQLLSFRSNLFGTKQAAA